MSRPTQAGRRQHSSPLYHRSLGYPLDRPGANGSYGQPDGAPAPRNSQTVGAGLSWVVVVVANDTEGPPADGEDVSNEGASSSDAKKARKKSARAAKPKKKTDDGQTGKKKAKAKKKAVKATKSRRKKAGATQLPPRSLVLTDADGQLAGVLPKHALVMVNRGIIAGEDGAPVGVDPRPSQRAFMWLLGHRVGQGLDPAAPHQRQALRVIEHLVRASVMADTASREMILRLYSELVRAVPQAGLQERADAPPLSSSDLGLAADPDSPPEE